MKEELLQMIIFSFEMADAVFGGGPVENSGKTKPMIHYRSYTEIIIVYFRRKIIKR
jgi:hypothetical protein